MLNETVHEIAASVMKGSCGEYEIIESYKGLQSILDILGDEFCPGVMSRDTAMCNFILKGQVNASNARCDAVARAKCVDEEEVKMAMNYLEYATGRDMDRFCR